MNGPSVAVLRPSSQVRVLPGALFVASFMFFWVSTRPYPDLGDPATLLPSQGSNLLNQITAIGLAASLAVYASRRDLRRFRVLFSWPLLALMAWLLIATVTSNDPLLSARRYVLTLLVFSIAAVALVLPRDRSEFALLVAVVSVAVLLLSYAGIALLPNYAVHQISDLLEPQHAGHWRGPFAHKNGAGAGMVLLMFMGLFVRRVLSRSVGWTIVLAAGVFLLCTQAKTSIALVAPVLVLAHLVAASSSWHFRLALVVGVLATTNLFTVGSVIFEPIQSFLASVMTDPTFTNRTDIWSFALGKATERPWLGHGFEAFWGSTDVFFGESSSWANRATDAHSGYVDMLLTTGIPGLGLTVLAFVIAPVADITRADKTGNDRATTLLFSRIWLYGVFYGCFESFFFVNGGAAWFMLLVALFGLRFQARTVLVAETAPARARASVRSML